MSNDIGLKDAIQSAVKDAMRAGDRRRLGVLRLITAAIKQREVDERIDMTDDLVLPLLDKMVKQRKEALDQYQKAGRDDLADQERFEIGVIQEFLPQPLSESEVENLIDEAIAESGASELKDMGKVMGVLRPKLQGRADMGAASARVKGKLGG